MNTQLSTYSGSGVLQLIYNSISLLQFDKSFFHFFLSYYGEESFHRNPSRTGPEWRAFPVSLLPPTTTSWPNLSTESWSFPLSSRQGFELPSEDPSCLLATTMHPGLHPCLKKLMAVISWNPTCCLASIPGVQPIILGAGPSPVLDHVSSYLAEIVLNQDFLH